MAITPLPSLDRTSPTFKADVDTFFASELPTFSVEVEAARVAIVSAESTATTAASTATTQAGIATTGAGTATTQAGTATTQAGIATAAAAAAAASAASITAQVSTAIHGATGKTTPVDADEIGIVDSAASNVLKKLTWANLKATLKTYLDTLYAGIGVNSNITSLTGLTSAIYATDQFQLTLVAGNIKMMPFNGNTKIVGGRSCTVPDAGVTLAPTGLSPGFYWLYCTQSAGVVNALEASATGFAVSTTAGNKGVKIKTGDDTRSWVGAVYVETLSTFTADSANVRLMRSAANEGPVTLGAYLSGANVAYSTATFAEVSGLLRCKVVLLPGEALKASCSGTTSNNGAGNRVYTGVAFNNTTTTEVGTSQVTDAAGGSALNVSHTPPAKTGLTPGFNYVTVVGKPGAGTATWTGSTTGQDCLAIAVEVIK